MLFWPRARTFHPERLRHVFRLSRPGPSEYCNGSETRPGRKASCYAWLAGCYQRHASTTARPDDRLRPPVGPWARDGLATYQSRRVRPVGAEARERICSNLISTIAVSRRHFPSVARAATTEWLLLRALAGLKQQPHHGWGPAASRPAVREAVNPARRAASRRFVMFGGVIEAAGCRSHQHSPRPGSRGGLAGAVWKVAYRTGPAYVCAA